MRKTIAALFGAFLIVALAVPAFGDSPAPGRKALLDSTVRFLQESQQQSGGFAQAGEPNQGTSAWVALALAAAGVNPRNQAQPCGTDAYTYLLTHFHEGPSGEIATTDLERELLVVNASGADPHDFAGFDLVGELLKRQLSDGSFPFSPGGGGQVNTTIFAILALSTVGEPAVQTAVGEAARWLLAQQSKDGSWYWLGEGSKGEVDMTGAAIEALNAAGIPSDSAQQNAFEYLEDAQLRDGGFPALPETQKESNVASTAWAVQGIWSAGRNPETWRTGSRLLTEEPLDYMESMQEPDGHIRWSRASDVNGVWMTAYVAPAFAGQALPIPAAAFSSASVPPCEAGGSSKGGVIAGGGGQGAHAFSRPKPQSKGKTPGGARVVHNQNLHPQNHSKTRRGENDVQPTGTETTEASSESQIATVSSGGEGGDPGAGGSGGQGQGSDPGAPVGTAQLSEALGEATKGTTSAAESRDVSGVVIGDPSSGRGGRLAFGAPGLHSANTGTDEETWVAVGVGAAAALLAVGGAGLERRRREVFP